MISRLLLHVLLITISLTSCTKEQSNKTDTAIPILERIAKNSPYQTKNVIVVVIDGPRYSETWGDPLHQYIPRLSNQLASQGVVYSRFYNNGPTYTIAGHTAITTGNYQEINNKGYELPQRPSFFQYWSKQYNHNNSMAWVITSKDKLAVLSDCREEGWRGSYNPSTDSGIAGRGSGYREDNITYNNTIRVLTHYHPQLVLVNFREPDFSAHKNDWNNYTKGISATDEYTYRLWNFIEQDDWYKGSTTMFVTNDHGRHLDDTADGFVSHGDGCAGCKHINLFAIGPDFNQGMELDTPRELIDIPATIAELMQFEMPTGQGVIMTELFSKLDSLSAEEAISRAVR
jgi:alkaline phosphatase